MKIIDINKFSSVNNSKAYFSDKMYFTGMFILDMALPEKVYYIKLNLIMILLTN